MKPQQQAAGAQPEFTHNPQASQYELRMAGQVAARAVYRTQGDAICFTHTEVQPQHEGQGLGSRLAAYALDDVKTRGLKAVPQCPFIAKYIQKNEKEYGELVRS
jgi:hypothetical protein